MLNSDQTPSKYVTICRTTMTPKNSNHVGLAGSTGKCSIILTLTKFSTSVNEKHYSNNEEVIKHLQEIFIPYVNEERKKMEVLINMHY